MRQTININRKWALVMDPKGVPDRLPAPAYYVNLPHTFNAIDGQDGGGDYFRGVCAYVKPLSPEDLPEGDRLFLEIQGANSSADVYVGGKHLAHHDGGYATWRVEITDHVSRSGETLLVVTVNNAPNETVYPQMADFTFYGGLYRDVNLIGVPDAHFDLTHFGGPGLAVTPVMHGRDAHITVNAYLTGAQVRHTLRWILRTRDGDVAASAELPASQTEWQVTLPDAHLWHGRKDPYLYTAHIELRDGDVLLDAVTTRFGCRTFAVDPDKGFFLNGEAYPLRGVSRHQDRWGLGNALLPEHHTQDMALIAEMGANTIRLAHYQHDRQFYDLCDIYGMVVWAEIPYISQHMPGGRENTMQQMRELIVQNYNHPSIAFWGLSNEITMKGAEDPDLIDNHRALNDLCHALDKTRLTAVAALSMCDIHAEYLRIPDVVAYNHYFGWYGGETDMNGPWFDRFHRELPRVPIGVSEYGCEGLNWHTSDPVQGDYTEEYQAHYHEELIRQLFARPYLFATYVWNMFDFGADNRAEGGENGQNHKGLITFDRRYKKDAFYAYKAWLSDEPFVHLCSKRYIDRTEDVTRVKVYSNCPEVELFANGKSLGKQRSADHFFVFEVPNVGRTRLRAIAGECRDESQIHKVDAFNESYRLREKGAVLNWFDIAQKEGYYSLNDKLSDILKSKEASALFGGLMQSSMHQKAMGFEMTPEMMQMMGGFTLLRLTGLMGAMNVKFTKEELLKLNRKLQTIKKEPASSD